MQENAVGTMNQSPIMGLRCAGLRARLEDCQSWLHACISPELNGGPAWWVCLQELSPVDMGWTLVELQVR